MSTDRPDPTTPTDPAPEDTMSTDEPTPPVTAPATVLDEPRGPALGTLVWGCVALAVAGLLGAWELAGLRVDVTLVVPVAMVVLGLLLVVGAVATALRRRP